MRSPIGCRSITTYDHLPKALVPSSCVISATSRTPSSRSIRSSQLRACESPATDKRLMSLNSRTQFLHPASAQQQPSPLTADLPSFTRNGIKASAATLSSHHQPTSRVAARPTISTMDR